MVYVCDRAERPHPGVHEDGAIAAHHPGRSRARASRSGIGGTPPDSARPARRGTSTSRSDPGQTFMFEADGGNESMHMMDRVLGTILDGFGAPGLPGRPVHVPAHGRDRLEGQPLHRRDDQRPAHPEVRARQVQQRPRQRQRQRALRLSALRGRLSGAAARLLFALPLLCRGGMRAAHEFKLERSSTRSSRSRAARRTSSSASPLYLFKSVKFPVRGVEVDVEQSGAGDPARARRAAGRGRRLLENGRPLPASAASGRLALPVGSLVRRLRARRSACRRRRSSPTRGSSSTRATSTRTSSIRSLGRHRVRARARRQARSSETT